MRVQRGIRVLAVVLTTAGIAAPGASANANNTIGTFPLNAAQASTAHHPGSSDDWALAAICGGGAITLLGASVATSRRSARRGRALSTASGS